MAWRFVLNTPVIQPNQRLVDALDALKKSSQGFAQWRLLHGRIIITFRQPSNGASVFVMDRSVRVDIEASSWEGLLLQIEKVYNAQYCDVPLLIGTVCLALDEEAPLIEAKGTSLFSYKAEATLREVLLSIFDKVGDPALRYGLSGYKDTQKGKPYDQIWISKPGCTNDHETSEGRSAHIAATEERQQRLDTYCE